MKKNIFEQNSVSGGIVTAPKDELQFLQNDIFKNKGQIVNLSFDSAGNPIQIKIGDKTYTAGIKTVNNNYIVYDGRVLKLVNGQFQYLTKEGKIVKIAGIPSTSLTPVYNDKLKSLGLLGRTDLYNVLNQSINKLQELINKGAVGDLFRNFNDLLQYYYPTDTSKRLNKRKVTTTNAEGEETTQDMEFAPYIDKQKLESEYKSEDLSRYDGLMGSVWLPKGSASDLVGQTIKGSDLNCENTLSKYLGLALQSKATGENLLDDEQTIQYKQQIKKCLGTGQYDRGFKINQKNLDFDIRKSLEPGGFLNRNLSYKEIKKYIKNNVGGEWQLFENKEENRLKNIIHENLIQHSIDKKNKLIKEQKVVKTRFSLLKEGLNIKTKKDRIIFSNRLMSEMVYLETQGYDQQIISEGLFDMIQGIFGNAGEGIVQMIKQKMADWFLNTLHPDLQKTWVAGIIVNVFTDTNLMDIPKLLKCDFLTKKLAEAIIEEIPKQIQYKTGKTDWFYDTLRNSMLETLEESNFGQNLEKGLVSVVCPMLENIKGKFSGIESKIKSQALGLEAK